MQFTVLKATATGNLLLKSDTGEPVERRARLFLGRSEAATAFDPALVVQAADGPLAWFGVHDAPQAWPEAEAGGTAIAQWQEALSRTAFDQGMAEIHRAIDSHSS